MLNIMLVPVSRSFRVGYGIRNDGFDWMNNTPLAPKATFVEPTNIYIVYSLV